MDIDQFSGTYRGITNGDCVAIAIEFAGERDGIKRMQPGMGLICVGGGKIVEVRLHSSDRAQEDIFWGEYPTAHDVA